MKHPAAFSDKFIPIFAQILINNQIGRVLDPMAGTGKLVKVKHFGFEGEIYCNDLIDWEDAKVAGADLWTISDAEKLPFKDATFDAICTSPTYGNRMADYFESTDNSKRITYYHYYGKPLTPQNTGRMQYGDVYKYKHIRIYRECLRILVPNGIFILNISDHIRKGKRIPVSDWHVQVLTKLGLIVTTRKDIKTQRLGFGANSRLRVPYEHIITLCKRS